MGSPRKKKKSSKRNLKNKAAPKRKESGGRKLARSKKDDLPGSGTKKKGKPKRKTSTTKKTGFGGKSESGTRRRRKKTTAPEPRQDGRIRLARFLASTGLDSRRKCEEFITTGRVAVDGKVVSDVGTAIDPFQQKIRVDGELIRSEPKRYFVLNKPKGFLCTNNDPQGRRRAVDLVSAQNLRLFTVGRLDENSEGLILVTNDGEMANMLAHPRYEVSRTYRVQVAGIPKKETIDQLIEGIHFSHGFFKVRGVRRMKTQGKSSFLEIELTEGRNREIRRLFARVGHKVINLTRISFGPLKLGRLVSGKSRALRGPELQALRDFVASGGSPVKKKTPQKKTGYKKIGEKADSKSDSRKKSTANSTAKSAGKADTKRVAKKKAGVKKQSVSKARKPRGRKKAAMAEKPQRRRITLE